MRNLKLQKLIPNSVFFFVFLLGCASCNDWERELQIPQGETCVSSTQNNGTMNCTDNRFPENDPMFEYDRVLGKSRDGKKSKDFCSNSDDYFRLRADYVETKRKYLVCKKYPKKCV